MSIANKRRQLAALEKEIADLQIFNNDPENFVNAHQQANQAKQTMQVAQGSIFDETSPYCGLDEMQTYLNRMYCYELPSELNLRYWYEINMHWAAWWANYLTKNFVNKLDDPKLYRKIKEVAHYAILYGRAGMTKDLKPVIISADMGNNHYKCVPVNLLGINKYVDLNTTNIETLDLVEGENLSIFQPRNLSIGDYVTLIPYLGTIMYFEQCMNRNMSFLTIMPHFNNSDPAVVRTGIDTITDPFKTIVYSAGDGKVHNDLNRQPFNFITPPDAVGTFYEVMKDNINRLKQKMHTEYGRPINSQSGQELQSNSNEEVCDWEYVNREVIDNWEIFIKDFGAQTGAASFKDSEKNDNKVDEPKQEDKHVEEEQPNESPESNDQESGENKEESNQTEDGAGASDTPENPTEEGTNGTEDVEKLVEAVEEIKDEMFELMKGDEKPQNSEDITEEDAFKGGDEE